MGHPPGPTVPPYAARFLIRYPPPGPDQHALTGTFAPDLTLHTDQGTTSVAELMHTAKTGHRPADALLNGRPNIARSAHRVGCTISTR